MVCAKEKKNGYRRKGRSEGDHTRCGDPRRMCETLKTVVKRTIARQRSCELQSRTLHRTRPCNEAKRRRGYLNYDARMRRAIRPVLAAGAETKQLGH
ncbi:hypothetical protein EVAR_28811_1 [Eumeta japonica]|uniref:Uncharacterized protein n=1 Tax=Eumeta variegata TaxID=151549 RepID=A0A4C1WHG9_EUMVA|nr:hypothetical protein EVAR_28811_1 [Eumeta japonica]